MTYFPSAGDQLVSVFSGQLSGQSVQLCDARELHGFLGVGRDFTNWIKNRIKSYGFIEDLDFSPVLAKSSGGRNPIDYHITLDMAKELAMVEKTSRGREARRYFIACERQVQEGASGQQGFDGHAGLPVPVQRLLLTVNSDGSSTSQLLDRHDRIISLGDLAAIMDASTTLTKLIGRNELAVQFNDAIDRGLYSE
ncbi:hypothetical protein R84981_000962 [Carnimonas sp. R-84981]|uniref:antA/AntB antirepressor family protein n=1 Tax=Carnimonas bestiolae TaxID=3402172 RepID=UPI003EDC663F